jgi:Family of unknown function (DUF5706)
VDAAAKSASAEPTPLEAPVAVPAQLPAQTHGHTIHDVDQQIAFARHNFENLQGTIRAADAKVGAFLTIMFLLAVVTFPVGTEVLPKLRWDGAVNLVLSLAFLGSYGLFGFGIIRSLMLTVDVLRPRGVSGPAEPHAADQLLFYKHILAHRDTETYFHSVVTAPPDLLLRNLSDQVFQLARICDQKMSALDAATFPLFCSLYGWVLTMALGIWIARH